MTDSTSTIAQTTLTRRELHSGWQVTAAAGPAPAPIAAASVPATVPGSVHTDLLAEGLIPDPYLDDNESALAWIGLVDWTYRTTFEWADDGSDRHDLVFDGLDTVARISLNGAVIGETANQHRSYRFDVRPHLVDGENELVVAFASPVKYANAQSVALGVRQRPYPLPYDAIRKSACSFGWDWGIATYTSGIWRPVRLESWSTARLAEARVRPLVDDGGPRLEVDIVLERAGDAADVEVVVRVAGVDAAASVPGDATHATLRLAVPDAELWWPIGYGDQPLYDVAISLRSDAGELDARTRRVGFRSVRWDTTPDAAGTPFTLVVNDQPVFVKGANWIPDDALPVRVDRARYERRLRQALDANLNLIRVWGGGIYESDDFYELCDELGLLSWQDFLFACAAYAEEEPLRSQVEAEARENIVRLADHPSLVLLTGNNENLWGYEDWGWKLRLDGKTWGAYYYYELFPRLIDELSPHVPYAPGSPFSPGSAPANRGFGAEPQREAAPANRGFGAEPQIEAAPANRGFGAEPHREEQRHPNDESHGSMHLWEQWNRRDWPTYREHTPRFVAEFGWQGPPAWTTLTRAISDDPLTPESPGMIVHQKADEGNVKLTNGLVSHYRVPEDMETWHWAMQLNQAVAVRTALEHFRSWAPHTMGAIVWQLNDCWPVTSWAAIDGDERPKPLFYALKSAFAPRVVTVQPRGDALAAVVGNDTAEPWSGHLTLRRHRFDGAVVAEFSALVDVPARGTVTVEIDPDVALPDAPAEELLLAELDGVRGLWFYAEPRDSALQAPQLRVVATPIPGGTEVAITAANLVREIALLVDKIDPDAVADDALVTLLPGESATIVVRHGGVLDVDALTEARVLRSANQLVAP